MKSENDDFRPVDQSKTLRELRQLRDRVARLEEAIKNQGPPIKAVTHAEVQNAIDGVGEIIFNEGVKPLRDQVDRLEKETEALHLRLNACAVDLDEFRAFQYCGVYKPNRTYVRNQFATWNGGLWHCNRKTEDAPGKSSSWSLAVKSGDTSR